MDATDLYRDAAQSAKDAGLRYLTDDRPGLTRRRAGNAFAYYDAKGARVTDKKILARIASFVIPPAWTDVWISPTPTSHVQVTGRDARGRKQYRYHPQWATQRAETKFERLRTFGAEALPALRAQMAADLARRGPLDQARVVAVVLALMNEANIRVGNREYARTNESFGLTTFLDEHVDVRGAAMKFAFVGKKGVAHTITVRDRRLARLVRQCQDLPGQQLFQYLDEAGVPHSVDSADVNAYIRAASGQDFTAKDFRTWGGTVRLVESLEALLAADSDMPPAAALREATKCVAEHLGNTPTVCSKYYIHPQVVGLFTDGRLVEFLRANDAAPRAPDDSLSPAERLVLRMLT
ncbi:MAG: DNA topoisomerase IB [Hymenobacteraceae bacterium]|nr:DNA topoisomerase IB [Hymenobacteraceae bacterium]